MASDLPRLYQARPVARAITHRTRGDRHGPITRLMSPGDVGEMLKPFVFLDLCEAERIDGTRLRATPAFGHRHARWSSARARHPYPLVSGYYSVHTPIAGHLRRASGISRNSAGPRMLQGSGNADERKEGKVGVGFTDIVSDGDSACGR